MIKLFKKLVNWCYEPPIYISDVIVDDKFYIPAKQVFCYEKAKVKVKSQ